MQLAENMPLDLINLFSQSSQIYSKNTYQILSHRSKKRIFNYKFPG